MMNKLDDQRRSVTHGFCDTCGHTKSIKEFRPSQVKSSYNTKKLQCRDCDLIKTNEVQGRSSKTAKNTSFTQEHQRRLDALLIKLGLKPTK